MQNAPDMEPELDRPLNPGWLSYARTIEMLNTDEYELVMCSGIGSDIPQLSAAAQNLCIQYEKERPNEREDVRLLMVVHELGDKSTSYGWNDFLEFRLVKKGMKKYVRHRADNQEFEDPTLEWHAYVFDEVEKVLDKDGVITKDQFNEIKKRDINILYVRHNQ